MCLSVNMLRPARLWAQHDGARRTVNTLLLFLLLRFQVFTAASKMRSLWVLALCSLVEVNRRFRGAIAMMMEAPLKRQSTLTRLHGVITRKLLPARINAALNFNANAGAVSRHPRYDQVVLCSARGRKSSVAVSVVFSVPNCKCWRI
jgi:hypothetical protein